MVTRKTWARRGNTDDDVVRARGRLGAAIRDNDQEAAAQAARELTAARHAQRLREARALVASLEDAGEAS